MAVHRLTQHHGAGAAIPLVAAFFGADTLQIFAQHLQQRAGGWHILQRYNFAASDKVNWCKRHGFGILTGKQTLHTL